MALISFLSQEEIRNKILNKWRELQPNINTAEDSQIFMDSDALSEALFSIQVDAFSVSEEAFIAFATGERLSNLGIEKGIPRKFATKATGNATFSRAVLDTVNYVIPLGTEIGTQPATDGTTVNFITTEAKTIFGQISIPTTLAAVTNTSGGALPDSTDFFYVVTALDGLGQETPISNEASITTGGSGGIHSNSLTWDAVTNAVSYNIYTSATTGTETLLTNTTGVFFVHVSGNGDGTTSPPTVNNTGAVSVSADIEAKGEGANGNVPAGAISRLVDEPAGIETVSNAAATGSGSDEETDEEYRDRMQEAFIFGTTQSKTTKTGYEQTALSVAGVATATVVNPNSGVNRNLFQVFITSSETSTGLPSAQLLVDVAAVVNADDNRSPNDLIDVLSPTPININVTIQTIELDPDFDPVQVKINIQSAIIEYINQLPPGETVYLVGISNAVHDTSGVIDFNIILPTVNTTLANDEKAVAGNISVI